LEREEEYSKDKGKEPDYSLHPTYNLSEDINNSKIYIKEDFNLIKSNNFKNGQKLLTYPCSSEQQGFCGNSELDLNSLGNKKRKFSDFNDTDHYDEGKILKKVKIADNSSLIDDYADVSCEPLDIIDLDG
jgi:hypothetical protein